VATVANIDWPSEPGLTTEEQQREAIAILDGAQRMNLNALVLQVRPQCDALYTSDLEPWSYYLTGAQGTPPDPYYDPLGFWIEKAHDRGIELHAWFNPYRAHHPTGGGITETSVVRRRPELVVELQADGYFWLDPSHPSTQDYSYSVIMDVLRRYDIDGIHLDDYFYPYPAYNEGRDFPDDRSWQAYKAGGGQLTRAAWRRESVNEFIQHLYQGIKREKPHVKFGLSPFGIWRPDHPASIEGLDQYDVLYADARLWLRSGWLDYSAPQLYWPINQLPQSYPVLLGWWVGENVQSRHIWPGISIARGEDDEVADETVNKIMIARGFVPEAPGHIHFSMRGLLDNRGGLADSLVAMPYEQPALVPASPWLDAESPASPRAAAVLRSGFIVVTWSHEEAADVFRWVVYIQRGEVWEHRILNRHERGSAIDPTDVTAIAVSAVDRVGNESELEWISMP
jgi:uncharacterized lipoprotein YddW (UPF0748 family)